MEAMIKKLELKKVLNKYYLKIELADLNGNIYIIDKPFLSDPINFRKQVFGIMSAIGCYDLMNITTNNPNFKKVKGYYMNGLKIFENENEEWFTYDKEKERYVCQKADKKKRKVIDMLIEENLANISIDEGNIESVVSRSGTFQMLFNSIAGATFYISTQIYYGMGYPLYIGDEENIVLTKKSAQIFVSFVISLMKFFGINDMLKFGGNVEKLPLVEVTMSNNNEISSITNPDTGLGLFVNKKYDIINIKDFEKEQPPRRKSKKY